MRSREWDYSARPPLERLARHLARVWERRYQAAMAEFDKAHPPFPTEWRTWRRAKVREKYRDEHLRPHLAMLQRARGRVRDMICKGLI